jgi:hypothetical protein
MTFAYTVLSGSWIFLGVLFALLVGVIYGSYTRRGSGIDHHPYSRRYADAPGARSKPRISGREGIGTLSTRGTR